MELEEPTDSDIKEEQQHQAGTRERFQMLDKSWKQQQHICSVRGLS